VSYRKRKKEAERVASRDQALTALRDSFESIESDLDFDIVEGILEIETKHQNDRDRTLAKRKVWKLLYDYAERLIKKDAS
jgi:hypothetical protein